MGFSGLRMFLCVGAMGSTLTMACSSERDMADGPSFTVRAAPLELPGIAFACYDLLIENGAATPETVIARGTVGQSFAVGDTTTLCSTRFGNGAGGDISYVAPCDAQLPNHTVTLWVDGLYEGTPTAPSLVAYQDPCPSGCALSAVCAENADTPVTFNLTIMRPANQGFFDVAVNFDNIFCSAKVDCEYGVNDPIALLFHPASKERDQTVVLGLACTAGPGASVETVLFRDAIVITCNGFDPIVLDPTLGEGNVYGPIIADPNLADPVWQYATYFGDEALPCGGTSCNKRFWNVAIGFDPLAAGCTLTTTATASKASAMPDFTTPEATTWPVITHNVTLTGPSGGRVCTRHPLNGGDGRVVTSYTPIGTRRTFCHRYAAAFASDASGDCGQDVDPITTCWQPPEPVCPGGTWVYDGNMVIYEWSGGVASPPPEGYECISAITGDLYFDRPNGGLSWDGALNFAALESIGGDLTFTPPHDGQVLNASFPRLTSIGGTFGFYTANTTEIDLPSLATVGADFQINNLSVTRTFSFPSIESVVGTVQFFGNSGDVTIGFGETRPFCAATHQIGLGNAILNNNAALTFNLFADTVLVGGDVQLLSNPGSVELNASGALAGTRLILNNSSTPTVRAGGDVTLTGDLLVGAANANANPVLDIGGALSVGGESQLASTTGLLTLNAGAGSSFATRLRIEGNAAAGVAVAGPVTLNGGASIAGNQGGTVSIGVDALVVDDTFGGQVGVGIYANQGLTLEFLALQSVTWAGNDPVSSASLIEVSNNASLTFNAPALTNVVNGPLVIANNSGPLTVGLGALTATHSLIFASNAGLTAATLDLSVLATVPQQFFFGSNTLLSTCFIEAVLAGLSAAPAMVNITTNFNDTPCD